MAVKDLVNVIPVGAFIQGSRSTVLSTLILMAILFVSALVGGGIGGLPNWILILFAIALAVDLLLFFGAFVFLVRHDRDSLRSEKYGIDKLQITSKTIGDTESGFGRQIDGVATPNPAIMKEGRN